MLHELEGLPVAAIASLLGISAVTVRWHLAQGRRELARRLRFLSEKTMDLRTLLQNTDRSVTKLRALMRNAIEFAERSSTVS